MKSILISLFLFFNYSQELFAQDKYSVNISDIRIYADTITLASLPEITLWTSRRKFEFRVPVSGSDYIYVKCRISRTNKGKGVGIKIKHYHYVNGVVWSSSSDVTFRSDDFIHDAETSPIGMMKEECKIHDTKYLGHPVFYSFDLRVRVEEWKGKKIDVSFSR